MHTSDGAHLLSTNERQNYQGILLTRHCFDSQNRYQIHYWLATQQGPIKLVVNKQQSTFFVIESEADKAVRTLAKANIQYEEKALQLKDFHQQNVVAFYFQSLKQHYAAISELEASGIEVLEGDIRLPDRYLMERFIYSNIECTGYLSSEPGHLTLQQAQLKPSESLRGSIALSVLSIDIECAYDGELYSIGIQGTGKLGDIALVLMVGQEQPCDDVNIHWCQDEKALITAFIAQIQLNDPDILIGWNVVNFDCRILLKRAEYLGIRLAIARDNSVPKMRQARDDSNQSFISIAGRVVIDGIDALKVATYHFESFALDNVAHALLGRGKLVDDNENRMDEITHDFHHNKTKLARYNLEDCQLVSDIFVHTKLLDFLLLRSELTGLELDRVGGSVAAFTNLYLPKLHRAGYVAPNLPPGGGLVNPGGYVMESQPGLYENVIVLDFKSLYPSIIRTFKIDPMGLIEGLKAPDKAIEGFKDAYFSRDQHFLPDIITALWQQRDEAKKDKDSARSQAIKIIMNSFYGVLGSGGCRFYDTRLASSITLRGHQIMQQTAKWIEQDGYKVIYGDTDSTFVWLDGIEQSEVAAIGIELQDKINTLWRVKLHDDDNLQSALEIEFETHFQRFLMPTIRGTEKGSKKRYAGTKLSQDGSTELIFKGLETVRSDWTELAREFQNKLYQLVFDGDDPISYIQQTIEALQSGQKDKLLVYRKRLRRKLASYVKNVPPHVRAARIADEHNAALGRPLQYQNKAWIQYVLTVNGPEPKQFIQSPLDYQHYIDKQIKPIAEGILPFIGLNFEKINNPQLSLF
ncbi:DNA polymerase II [Catenovulum sp. SM1970]|uniref:DNA polymerase II n=1 Tax=Marinifaba aquimaris TaxID=2741323 RepID=UPI00157216F9|nr:DNA polymerase II [Marinifaba aquimaris]NTS77824.1 DNA polymerase II [Marinifaba aquimaris]